MPEKNRVGEKIRQLREIHEMSVEELAEKSFCSVVLIEQLEAGDLVPSLAPLMKIARALGVRLGTFLDDEAQAGPVVARVGCWESVVRFSGKRPASDVSALEFFSLASHKKDRHMEPFVVDVHASESDEHPLASHEGEEFIYVLSGSIEMFYGRDRYLLEAGDSIYYDSVVPHDVHAFGDGGARILAVVYAPL
ncbi:MAG TPA: XRE family transcriptional regulator [Candidatus Hydrogenedentes bacterium]|nr:XRE family transcriptional regulator [Candidatus Hydrogenedentota bacterium]HPG67133.1 XRE family transcriptional regulator [Candidatus Hydrogenedentota bacterium]